MMTDAPVQPEKGSPKSEEPIWIIVTVVAFLVPPFSILGGYYGLTHWLGWPARILSAVLVVGGGLFEILLSTAMRSDSIRDSLSSCRPLLLILGGLGLLTVVGYFLFSHSTSLPIRIIGGIVAVVGSEAIIFWTLLAPSSVVEGVVQAGISGALGYLVLLGASAMSSTVVRGGLKYLGVILLYMGFRSLTGLWKKRPEKKGNAESVQSVGAEPKET